MLFIRPPAAIRLLRNKYISGHKLRTAPAAFSAPAPARCFDPSTLKSDQNRLPGCRRDHGLFRSAADRDRKGLSDALGRISLMIFHMFRDAQDLTAHKALRQPELRDLPVEEAVHGLRAADEDTGIIKQVLSDQLRRDKSMFKSVLFLIRENVHDLYFRAYFRDLAKLLLKEDRILRSRTEEDRQIKFFDAVPYRPGHGQERRDTAAARKSEDIVTVPQVFIIELPLRIRNNDLVAEMQIFQHIVRRKASRIRLHRDTVFSFKRQLRGRAYGIGSCDK